MVKEIGDEVGWSRLAENAIGIAASLRLPCRRWGCCLSACQNKMASGKGAAFLTLLPCHYQQKLSRRLVCLLLFSPPLMLLNRGGGLPACLPI